MENFEIIKNAVQKNCDLIDAEHGQNYGLCIYLLKMRDYYRWRNHIPLHEDLINDKIHKWIADTEEYWDKIKVESLEEIPINGKKYPPFESDMINEQLIPEGLIYSGGLGYGGIPMFFLAKLDGIEERFGFKILFAGDEISRGLFGSPALYRDKTIYIRKETLKHLLWSRYEEWGFTKRTNTMGKALSFYPFDENPELALEQITETETDILIQHEIGEGLIGKEFGELWQEMIIEFAYTKTEILLRAVRDLCVDCMMTLPFILEHQRIPSLHMYFAGFSDMRKELFPSLYDNYLDWQKTDNSKNLYSLIEQGKVFWYDIGKKSVGLFKSKRKKAQEEINQLIEEIKL